ncbi:MAG: histidine kinase, partial [Bacteroidales bacterium]|nr:histidine kinase [Bacteroidales bacterium]
IPSTDKKNVAVIIFAGHAKYPRKLYLVDLQEDTVYLSKTDGNCFTSLSIEDVDGDSSMEFFGHNASPGNFHNKSALAFNDSSTYLMVFNENLEFEFPPVEFKSLFSRFNNFSFPTDTGNYYLSSIFDNSSPRTIFPVYLSDLKGNLVDSTFIGPNTTPTDFFKESPGIYAYTSGGDIYKITDFKNPEYLTNIKELRTRGLKFVEIGEKDGFFIQVFEKEIRFYDSKFKLAEKFKSFFTKPYELRITSFGDNSIDKGKLLFQDTENAILLNFNKNPLWKLRFFIVLLFLIISFYIMSILAFLLSYQQSKRLEREKEITELRFNAVKNQLEPHFLFNSLNSIGHLLLTEERMKAYSYLESLSFLLRNAINNSSEIAVPLMDELLFTRKYLDIEKLRFEEKFDFEINVSETVDNEFPVPKMIIQLHSENAVKHGLLHKETGGKIEIRLSEDQDKLIIEIDDNGAGRAAQTARKKDLGKGLKISEQMLELYQKVMKHKISQEIIDKIDSFGEPLGTHVIITVSKK